MQINTKKIIFIYYTKISHLFIKYTQGTQLNILKSLIVKIYKVFKKVPDVFIKLAEFATAECEK